MNITVKSKNVDMGQSLPAYIEKKFLLLEHFLNQKDAEVVVEVEKETKHRQKGDIFIIKAKLTIPGKQFMATAKADDWMKATVEAKEELEREILKHKTKTIDYPRHKRQADARLASEEGGEETA